MGDRSYNGIMSLMPTSLHDLEYELISNKLEPSRQEWRWLGQLHSFEDHPAVILDDGLEFQWWKHGVRHRDPLNGPARIICSGMPPYTEIYFVNGHMHRSDGPSMIMHGIEKWYMWDELHRGDGPAMTTLDGGLSWYLRGTKYELDDWLIKNHYLTEEEKLMIKLTYG
jgi:hypothetical protein